METLFTQAGSLGGVLASIGLTLATYLANKHLIPFLKVGRRQKYARHIGAIADEVTDELRLKYPDRQWLAHLDEAIDTLRDICQVSSEIAGRAVRAAAGRK